MTDRQARIAGGSPEVSVVALGTPNRSWQLAGSRTSVGTAETCDLVLDGIGVAARHLELVRDARGLVLEVMPNADPVYVNARPVHERAVLRRGDLIHVGRCKLLLRQPDAVPATTGEARPLAPGSNHGPELVSMRAVAGPLSGLRFGIAPQLVLDARRASGCEGSLRLSQSAEGIDLVCDPADATSEVLCNGLPTQSARLVPGDQIAWGPHRLVLEMRPQVHAEPDHVGVHPHEAAPPEDTAGPQNEVWWLIATAAVLALGMALLLLWSG